MRAFGLIVLLAALAALAADVAAGRLGAPASLGAFWAELHRTSLIGLQSGLENRVHPDAFFDWVLPVLELPAAPVLAALGFVLTLGRPLLRRVLRRMRALRA